MGFEDVFRSVKVKGNLTVLGTSSYGTVSIADNAVTNAKMADNSVGYLEIIDGSITTPKIVNGAVTAEKLDPAIVLGGGGFVPRRAASNDFTLICNGEWQSLDLSGICPVGTNAVLLRIERSGGDVTQSMQICTDRNLYPTTGVFLRPHANPIYTVADVHILPIEADRILDYSGDTGMNAQIAVLGWFI